MAPNARLIAPLNKERAVTMGASRSGRAALSPSVARGTRWNLARGRAGTFASIGSANVCSSSLLLVPFPARIASFLLAPDRKGEELIVASGGEI